MKKTEIIDGVRVLKLAESHPEERRHDSDAMALYKIWSLMTGADMNRELTAESRMQK